MTFGTPPWLIAAAVLTLVVSGFLAWTRQRRDARLAAAFPTPWLTRLTASVSPARRRAGAVLLTAAVATLALTLARPRWGRASVRIERTGIDLVIALDVSRSMLAPDVAGTNRLAAARLALHGLLDSLGGDRAGLVIFAGEAYLAAPLTRDHAAVGRTLDDVDPGSVSEPGSDIAKAITLAREGFDRAREGPRALLIVSDGEQLRGDALGAARAAVAAGITVHTAAVGSPAGARIPARTGTGTGTGTHVRNAFGREVVTRLDAGLLQRIADAGHGLAVRIHSPADDPLSAWFAAASATLPRTTESRDLSEPRERFQWPLALALACLAAQGLIGERRRQPAPPPPSRRPPPMPSPAVHPQNPPPQHHAQHHHHRLHLFLFPLLTAALLLLPRPAPAAPAVAPTTTNAVINPAGTAPGQAALSALPSPWQAYNEGVAAYASGDYATAHDSWSRLASQPVPRRIRSALPFQIGNAEFRLGEPLEAGSPEQAVEWWRRSRTSFRTTLDATPRHHGARRNLQRVEERLARATHRLGRELLDRARTQPVAPAIDLLRSSLEHLDEAVELDPRSTPFSDDRTAARDLLRDRLLERARESENRGDASASSGNNESADARAATLYRESLADLDDAVRIPTASGPDPRIAEAEQRVRGKLARLLTRAGERAKLEARAYAASDPDEALDHYDRALEHFQAAQEAVPGHEPARQGEREVRAEMERLHVRRGNEQLAQGRAQLNARQADAAASLTESLDNFEAALEINPESAEARRGAAEARSLLPEALAQSGNRDLQRGARAEKDSAAAALPHVEDAEAAFSRALQLQPGHEPSRQGLGEASRKLEQLRSQVRRESEEQSRRLAQLRGGRQPTLGDLLGPVEERRRTRDTDRQRQRSQNQPKPRSTYPDW